MSDSPVAWYQRFRKALAVLPVVLATPGVLGVLDLLGVHIAAGVFATIVTLVTLVAAPITVAAVPNALSAADLAKANAAKDGE